MSSIDESNVDRYKSEHECDEHWELRRKFLLTHSDKFNLGELLCLARVFTNVEFLGCKYPPETMQQVAELSREIVKDYKEKQKNRLKRTFVGASEAASSKAKGQFKSEKSIKPETSVQSSNKEYQPHYSNFKRKQETIIHDTTEAKRKKTDTNAKTNAEDVVLFEYLNDTPQAIISRAANSYDIDLDWKFDKINDNHFTCSLFFNKHKVSEAKAASQKVAKKEASVIALEKMQKIYYTVKVTKNLTPTISEEGMQQEPSETVSDVIGKDNIGSKMMKLMGWSGGGLGKSSQGITEPVQVQQQMTREGLGLKPGMYNMHVFKKKCFEVLQNYIQSDIVTASDLVFSPSFSNEERATIHQIAKQLGLKSQSYGPKNQRTLTISRKINPQSLVNELKRLGGSTEKYQLIEPTEKK